MTFYTRQNKILNEIGFFFLCIESDTAWRFWGNDVNIHVIQRENNAKHVFERH